MKPSRQRARSRLTPLQAGLAAVLGEEKLRRLADIGRIRRDWPRLVGPMLAQHSEPVSIEKGCLLVAVDHPAMAQQFRFLQQEIREACFRRCRIRSIGKLHTRIQSGAGMHRSGTSDNRPPRRLSLREKREIAVELRAVRNKALRRSMFYARMNQLRFSAGE